MSFCTIRVSIPHRIDEQVATNRAIGERQRVVAAAEIDLHVPLTVWPARSIVTRSLVPPKSTRMPRETPSTVAITAAFSVTW